MLNIMIGVPLRDVEGVKKLIDQLADPRSPQYRSYLSPLQFTHMFGATEADYKAVVGFANANGLTITGTVPNRMLVDLNASVADLERTFDVKIGSYRDPDTNRIFRAPDREPSVPQEVPVLEVIGLDDLLVSQPARLHKRDALLSNPNGFPGPFTALDLRTAYAPGVTLDGSGQTVAVFSQGGYWPGDIANFTAANGLPTASVTTVLVSGDGIVPAAWDEETPGDIEMVLAMAPKAQVLVYEGYVIADILNRIATDNVARQITSSYVWAFGSVTGYQTYEQILMEFAAQGQTMFASSGDSGAWNAGGLTYWDFPQTPYVTSVGGTLLTTNVPGGTWLSETAWSYSGGGVVSLLPIPSWEQSIPMSANGGSTASYNYPNVSMAAGGMTVCDFGGECGNYFGGTSAASPLWAGFMALVNQQAASAGVPPVGFLNPALTLIGNGPNYSRDLHDITTGNNQNASSPNPASPNQYPAVPGFDLATGWGTPAGQPLIDDLTQPVAGAASSFNLSIAPYAVAIIQGSSGSTGVTIGQLNGFTGNVSLAVSGLPTGVGAAFLTNSATTSTLILSVGNSVTAGAYVGSLTGTSGSLSHSVAFHLNVIAPDFGISALPAIFNVTIGQPSQATITVSRVGNFTGSVSLSASGLPQGVQMAFSPATATTTSVLTISATGQATIGPASITINGTAGGVSHSASLGIVVVAASAPAPVPVDLSPYYNFVEIGTDASVFNSKTAVLGLYPNLLGTFQVLGGVPFFFGPSNTWDAVLPLPSGQTLPLPSGSFVSLELLGNGWGSFTSDFWSIEVNYTDGTSDTFEQGFSLPGQPNNYPNEQQALQLPYMLDTDNSGVSGTCYVYLYSFPIDKNKRTASLTVSGQAAYMAILGATLVPANAQSINAPPALSVTKTHLGNFSAAQTGATYTVTVSNASGAGATSGMVTVTELLPGSLTLTSMAGTGWTCAGGETACTRSDALAAGASYSTITVTVNVAPNAWSQVINQVTVSGGGALQANGNDATTIGVNLCSITQDGNASVADVQRIINQALGVKSAVNDLSQDGVVNVLDVQIEINAALGFGCAAN